jgi:DNA-binding CsgD family transcriptional regulator
MDEAAIERALDACYDAVVAPENWSGALHGLARSLDAACIMFYARNPSAGSADPHDPTRPFNSLPASHDYKELLEEYERGGWYLGHYRAERGVPLLDAGRKIVLEHDLASDEERKRLRHYNEFYLRWGFPGFAMVDVRCDGRAWAVTMLRGEGQGHFTRKDARRLAPLAPHFRRLVAFSERFALNQTATGINVLEKLGVPALLLDWRGVVVGMNASAEAALGSDIFVMRGRLTASHEPSNRSLQAFLAQLVAADARRTCVCPRPVAIQRPDKRPIVVDAMPVESIAVDVFGHTRAVVVLSDLECHPRPPVALLRACFGLTAAEAKLTVHIASGETIGAAADQLGIANETARNQLKSIFQKTEVHRQSELVGLLARLPNLKDAPRTD